MIKKLVVKIIWPAYLIGLVTLGYMGFDAYSNASAILKDHSVVDATTEFVRVSSRTKRGHTSVTWHFKYSYTANGTDYSFPHSAVNEKGERYLDQGYMTIAYSNTEPARSGPLHVLQEQSSFWRLVKSMLIVALVLGLVALFAYGWALPDDEEEEEGEAPESVKV